MYQKELFFRVINPVLAILRAVSYFSFESLQIESKREGRAAKPRGTRAEACEKERSPFSSLRPNLLLLLICKVLLFHSLLVS